MRGFAQLAFGVFVVFVAMMFKQPALLLAFYPIGLLCALPVAYYYIFERHREGHSAEIAAHLERIADALRTQGVAEQSVPSRRSPADSVLLRS